MASGVEGADVGAVVQLDPLVGLQPPDQLPVADVDRDHLAGAAAQQDIGEAAGRRAGVQASAAGDDDVGNASSAPISLCAPRDAQFSSVTSSRTSSGAPGSTAVAGLGGDLPGDGHPAGGDQLGGVLAGSRQAAADQFGVQPGPTHPARPAAGGPRCRRSGPAPRPGWRASRSKTGTCVRGAQLIERAQVVLDALQQPASVVGPGRPAPGSRRPPGRRRPFARWSISSSAPTVAGSLRPVDRSPRRRRSGPTVVQPSVRVGEPRRVGRSAQRRRRRPARSGASGQRSRPTGPARAPWSPGCPGPGGEHGQRPQRAGVGDRDRPRSSPDWRRGPASRRSTVDRPFQAAAPTTRPPDADGVILLDQPAQVERQVGRSLLRAPRPAGRRRSRPR